MTSSTYATSSIEVANFNDGFSVVKNVTKGPNQIAVSVHQAPPVGNFFNPDAVFGSALAFSPAPEIYFDTNGPVVKAAFIDDAGTSLTVYFNEIVTSSSQTEITNYSLFFSNAIIPAIITNVNPISSSNVVLSLQRPVSAGAGYMISVSNLLDIVGNSSNGEIRHEIIPTLPLFGYNVPWFCWMDTDSPAGRWNSLDYNDSAWLGHKNPAMAPFWAGASSGPRENGTALNAGLAHTAFYFRKRIQLPENFADQDYVLRALFEDGAIIYVNGVEIHRNRMPQGIITHSTRATENITGPISASILVPSGLLVPGENIIAAEVHISGPPFVTFVVSGYNAYFALKLETYSIDGRNE